MDPNTILLALLNLMVGVIGAFLRFALKDIGRRLDSMEALHQEHISWHMAGGPDRTGRGEPRT